MKKLFLAPASSDLPVLHAQELKLETGEEIFKAACIGCHGPNGKGQLQTMLGFEPPSTFPDFTDCNGSTRENTFDWCDHS
jgi:mono/diheme cytochrome c family protein